MLPKFLFTIYNIKWRLLIESCFTTVSSFVITSSENSSEPMCIYTYNVYTHTIIERIYKLYTQIYVSKVNIVEKSRSKLKLHK